MAKIIEGLELIQLERKIQSIHNASLALNVPTGGWLKYIRKAMGLSITKLAELLDQSQSTISGLEKREVEGKITLKSLQKIATLMDCDLVYSIVPRKSLQETINSKALLKAQELLKSVDLHMSLEDQRVVSNKNERLHNVKNALIKAGDIW